ncbi:MAG: trypsin-like peptidase domain-containing protein [Flavobacteriales bacterium]|nr:trypsin-like peptidase domain-containing protein [Flavobacteriales bacterium]
MLRSKVSVVSILALEAIAQIPQGGSPYGWGQRSRSSSALPSVVLDALPTESRATVDSSAVFRIGTQRWFQADVLAEGLWDTLPGELVRCRFAVKSVGAAMVALQFDVFDPVPDMGIYIYDKSRTTFIGGFTEANEMPDGTLATALLPGSEVVIEVIMPVGTTGGALHLASLTHAFLDPFKGTEEGVAKDYDPGYQSAACHNNINCAVGADWQQVKRSTAMFIRPDGATCTGTLINNTQNNGTPYFLTANHCYQPNESSWVFYFNYESTGCVGTSGSTAQSLTGCTLKSNDYYDDFALMQLNSVPPASYQPYYSGWDRTGATPTKTTTLSHPSSDVKKITFDNNPPTSYTDANTTYWRTYWDSGIIQAGSSGAPLFDQNKRLVGVVTTGNVNATCSNMTTAWTGSPKLTQSWDGTAASTRLRDWLDPANTTTVLDGYEPSGTPPAGVKVKLKVMLEGPYVSGTGLMNGTLRSSGLVPLAQPYTALGYAHVNGGGSEVTTSTVLNITGSASVVDWVVVELRNKNNSATVLASRCALLLRNGTIVDPSGTGDVSFPLAADNYFIAVHHRNHLGIMTASAQALSSTATLKDLTNASVGLYGGTSVVKNIGGVRCMFAGDANFSNMVKYAGTTNDRDPILTRIGGLVPTNSVSGYYIEDLNMDGVVRYAGTANDRDVILNNVGGTSPNNTVTGQVP